MNSILDKGALFLGLMLIATGVNAQKIAPTVHGSFEAFIKNRLPSLTSDPSRWLSKDQDKHITPSSNGINLVPPKYPFSPRLTQLPESSPHTHKYREQLTQFFDDRQRVLQVKDEYQRTLGKEKSFLFTTKKTALNADYFTEKVINWNGNIFWAPASQSTDIIIRFGDEVRAVFGPIPRFDVTKLGKFVRPDGFTIETLILPLEVDGNKVELKVNTSKPGNPYEYEHTDTKGNFVKWTATIDRCDKPSLAGGVTPCGTASRISRAVKGNVEWIALARKTKKVQTLDSDPYWAPSNPYYALLGYIGFNKASGELAFFDGTYVGVSSEKRFNWNNSTVQPGGLGYSDEQGRAESSMTYDATFNVDCAQCHDNKEPRIITLYIKQARVGYRDAERASEFSLGNLLPALPRNMQKPYRVVGSDYTAAHAATLKDGRAIIDPTGNCSSQCHGLTNLGTARFASDSVGRLGSLTEDSSPENGFRTNWALSTGDGKIHPWMAPFVGNDLSDPSRSGMSDSDWNKLKAILENPGLDARSLKLYTEAPAPESVLTPESRTNDASAPTGFLLEVTGNREGVTESFAKEIHFSWKYLNSFGGVPERDDVRFHLAILETEIPSGGVNTPIKDFPTVEQTKGIGATQVSDNIYRDGEITILKDITFSGHLRWTDPAPAITPRQYFIALPAAKDKRYLIRLMAKRYTFDQTVEKYSDADHVFSVDTR